MQEHRTDCSLNVCIGARAAIKDQGNLYAMGYGGEGQLGLGPESTLDRAVPTLIERQSWKTRGKEVGRVKQISSSTDFTLALTESNQLWIWGSAEHGQCMINKKMYRVSRIVQWMFPFRKIIDGEESDALMWR
jgi:alpha-tubulin suppressor-like RCC1 family protein